MARSVPPLLRRAADGALTVGALLGVVALLGAVLGGALGVRPLFFRSGSMAPTIDTGSLALARSVPATQLRAGDVVSVRTPSGTRVTHRVVRVDPGPGPTQVALTLRGDANRTDDPAPYVVGSAYRVFWHVPGAGYAAGAVLSPAGLVLGVLVLGLLVLGLLAVGLLLRGLLLPTGADRLSARGRHAARSAGRRRLRRAGATAVATAAVLSGPTGAASAAPWTDSVTVSGTSFTAATVPAPSSFACSGVGVLSVSFSWPAVSGATSYTLHYDGGSQTKTVTAPTTSASISGVVNFSGTAWVVANRAFGSVTWSSPASNSRSYTYLLAASLCA